MKKPDNTLIGDYRLADAPIGAGGFVVNGDQHPTTGRLIVGHDVGSGALLRDSGNARWRWAFTPASVPLSEVEPGGPGFSNDGYGVGGIRIAPSDQNRIYVLWRSGLWKTTDGALNWSRTSAGELYILPNIRVQRLSNSTLDVHPTNADILLFGTSHYATDTSKSGVFFSLNGGNAKTKVSALPAPADSQDYPGRYLVAIDPGQPATAYAYVSGSGLWRSDSWQSNTGWSLVYASTVRASHLQVLANGDVWIARGGVGGTVANDLVKRTRAGTATTYTTTLGQGAQSVAINPANTSILIAGDPDGPFALSFDGGTSWEQPGTLGTGPGEVAWLSGRNGGFFTAKLFFDALVPNKVWCLHGLGVAWTILPTSAGVSSITWTDHSNGMEEKVASAFLSVPGKSRIRLGNWDYADWPMDSLTEWTNRGSTPGGGLAIAKRYDYAENNKNVAVLTLAQVSGRHYISPSLGDSWNLLPNVSGFGPGGTIAMNTDQQIILLETNNGKGHWTANGGTSWGTIQLTPGTDTIAFSNAEYVTRHSLSADKTSPGRFALVYTVLTDGGATGPAHGGLWLTENSGQGWTRKITGVIGASIGGTDQRQYWACQLEYIPGFSGEILYTAHSDDAFLGDFLFHITGATVAGTTNVVRLGGSQGVTDVNCFAFGPIAPGQTRPSVAFYGKVNGVRGLYSSYDWFATAPVLLARFPLDNLSVPAVVGCDRNRLGRVFAGGIGWRYTTRGKRLKVKAP